MDTTSLEKCEGYLKLRKLADENIEHGWEAYRVNPKFDWVIERAKHYSDKLSISINDILNAWVDDCDYSFMNYFQDANQPEINADKVKVFGTVEELRKAVIKMEFRCPNCEGVSTNPSICNSGIEVLDGETCNWKVYGLFGDLGKGAYVYIKDKLKGENIFMPISWENVTA